MNRSPVALLCVAGVLLSAGPASASSPTWQPAASLSPAGHTASAPQIAVNARGDSAASWTYSMNGKPAVQGASRAAGKPWNPLPPFPTGPVAGTPRIGIDDSGQATVVWVAQSIGASSLWMERFGMGGGSTSAKLAQSASDSALAVSGRGDTVVAWVAPGAIGQQIEAIVQPAGGIWSDVDVLTPTPNPIGPVTRVDVAIDPQGDVLVAWSRNN